MNHHNGSKPGEGIGGGLLDVSVSSKAASWSLPVQILDVQIDYGVPRFLVRPVDPAIVWCSPVLVDARRVAVTEASAMLRRLVGASPVSLPT